MKSLSKRLIVALASLLALPVAGDWLVMQDGAKVETKGPWKVKGASVVFTLPSGTLSSLRLAEVDLDASSLATAKARQPQETPKMPPPVRRQPALVLTDKDIPRAAPLPAPAAAPGEVAEEPAAKESEETSRLKLEIADWRSIENAEIDGLEITGEVQNAGEDLAFGVGVTVILTGADGDSVGSAEAFVAEKSLAPRTRSGFRALFPGVYELDADPTFELTALNIRIGLPGADGVAEPGGEEDLPEDEFEEAGGSS